jgi:hypothetical protein
MIKKEKDNMVISFFLSIIRNCFTTTAFGSLVDLLVEPKQKKIYSTSEAELYKRGLTFTIGLRRVWHADCAWLGSTCHV